jgi:predicted aspartyl protease
MGRTYTDSSAKYLGGVPLASGGVGLQPAPITPQPHDLTAAKRAYSTFFSAFWLVTLILILARLEGKTWAQSTIYSWTDEKGVVHFSNSMIPPQHAEHATTIETPSLSLPRTSGTDTSDSIPLVILNNDPSQKFVRAELTGDQDKKEVLMLVDTGAQITLIDQSLAEELALEHIDTALLTGVTGSAVGWIGRLPILRLGQAEVRDLDVIVGPMRGRLLLGMDVLERLELSVGPRSLQRARP